jgi:ribonuclease-3
MRELGGTGGAPGQADGALEQRLGHRFRDRGLLETALTHASYAHEADGGRGNERLEFLGDAVIGLVVAQLLFSAHPDWSEGELTRARAALVNRQALAGCARVLALGTHLRLGRTERRGGGELKPTILADCFEALVGAVYLEAGLGPVEALVRRLFGAAIEQGPERDAKTAFQEWAHARFRETPVYRTARDSGGEEDDERFEVEVLVGGEVWGAGSGRSKRVAERRAARRALARVADADAGGADD